MTKSLHKLTKEELEEVHQRFSFIDTNKDGKISYDELKSIVAELDLDITEQEITDWMQSTDTSKDGLICYGEFLAKIKSKKRNIHKLTQEELQEAHNRFNFFDKNKDGKISYDELKSVMAELGINMAEREISDWIESTDTSKDGLINYREFLSKYKRND